MQLNNDHRDVGEPEIESITKIHILLPFTPCVSLVINTAPSPTVEDVNEQEPTASVTMSATVLSVLLKEVMTLAQQLVAGQVDVNTNVPTHRERGTHV